MKIYKLSCKEYDYYTFGKVIQQYFSIWTLKIESLTLSVKNEIYYKDSIVYLYSNIIITCG